MYQNRYTINLMGSKVTIQVLRTLYDDLHRYTSVSEISNKMETSRANVHRGLKRIEEMGLIRRSQDRGGSLIRIDTSSIDAFPFFQLFNNERIRSSNYKTIINIKNLIDQHESEIDSVILFGSHARGHSTETSDIDLIIISKSKESIRKTAISMLPEVRFDLHFYSKENLENRSDLILVDAILFGISMKGDEILFRRRSSIESIQTSYVRWRLESCRNNLKRYSSIKDETRRYFLETSLRTLVEIRTMLGLKSDIEENEDSIQKGIREVEMELNRRGEKIWLN